MRDHITIFPHGVHCRPLLLQVIDLGSAEFVAVGQEVPHAFGTVRYSSPEMAAHSAGPASDVWSAGVLLCHVLTGRVPFLKDNDLDTLEMIRKGPEVRGVVCGLGARRDGLLQCSRSACLLNGLLQLSWQHHGLFPRGWPSICHAAPLQQVIPPFHLRSSYQHVPSCCVLQHRSSSMAASGVRSALQPRTASGQC